MNETLIELKEIAKSFGQVKVIEGISFKIDTGKVYALAGENGAGKSTLCNIISGSLKPTKGTLVYKGKEYSAFSISQAKEIGIKMVHQELQVLPLMTIYENIFIGEEVAPKGFVDANAMRKRAKELLGEVGLHIDPDTLLGEVDIAGRQLIEIARALNKNARLIILDEPTSSLTSNEIIGFFNVVRRLKNQGVSFIFISHRIEEIFELSDEIIVLKDGAKVAQLETSQTKEQEIINLMVGRSYSDYYNRKRSCFGKEIFKVEHLSAKKEGVYRNAYMPRNISFSISEGEVLGIAGLVGAGRTELIRVIFGELEKGEGNVYVQGQKVDIKDSKQAIKLGMAWVTENRKEEGLILESSINDNMVLPVLTRNVNGPFIKAENLAKITEQYIKKLNIKTIGRNQIVKRLSGGNQQKVVVGKWLSTNPKVLIMDEPTRGIDVGAKVQIYNLINELTAQGMAILLISSELPEVMGMSDRMLVMYEGSITGELDRTNFTETNIMQCATGRNRE